MRKSISEINQLDQLDQLGGNQLKSINYVNTMTQLVSSNPIFSLFSSHIKTASFFSLLFSLITQHTHTLKSIQHGH
jgi:MFS-type transporter involved in bile tolerance (Atg22 family)